MLFAVQFVVCGSGLGLKMVGAVDFDSGETPSTSKIGQAWQRSRCCITLASGITFAH